MASASPPPAASLPSQSPPPFQSSQHTLITPEFNMNYNLHGDPDSPNKLLLIMGFLTDGAAWAYQVDYFARRGFQVVTYDNRGVARSSTPKNIFSYTTSNMAKDALLLANHLRWEQFHLVGVSMGGMIALELALAVPPQRISSLTLIVTHAGGWGGFAPWIGIKRMVQSIFTGNKQSKLETLMALLYSQNTLDDPQLSAILRAHHETRIKNAIPPKMFAVIGHTLATYRHFVSYPNLLRLRFAPFNTLVIVGSEDQLVRRSNSYMLARVLGAKLFEVQHGGHGLLAQFPQAINEEMLKHFMGGRKSTEEKNAASATDANGGDNNDDLDVGEGDFTVESQEALMDDAAASSSEAGSPYSLEEEAVSLACTHTVHCSMHNIAGFITGFVPAFVFRWIFYDSIALNASPPVSRWEQSMRFGLLIGMVRSAIRAIRCIMHAYRARQWVLKHQLRAPTTEQGSSTSSSANNVNGTLRKGLPQTFEFPYHSILLLGAYIFITWQKQLLAGIV